MEWIVSKEDNGKSVKEFLHLHAELSSKMLKYVKYRERGILVNEQSCTVRKTLSCGDRLTIDILDRESPEELEAVDLPIEIIYEDEDFVVPAKPAKMPTHPSHDHWGDTVANALAYRYREKGVPFVFRPINRLDRDTSGLLLIARNKLAAGILTESMKAGKIKKTYYAVLEGTGLPSEGVIEAPLHRTEKSVILREVCPPDAPDAEASRTEYKVLCEGIGASFVKAYPITGRTHQLRVHFASLGHPIIGDFLYGKESPLIPRQALHAGKLVLPHPKTGETMCFSARLPQDMRTLISQLFPSLSEDFLMNV